jgi:hypothetical protein
LKQNKFERLCKALAQKTHFLGRESPCKLFAAIRYESKLPGFGCPAGGKKTKPERRNEVPACQSFGGDWNGELLRKNVAE